jgi:hypothetical protein
VSDAHRGSATYQPRQKPKRHERTFGDPSVEGVLNVRKSSCDGRHRPADAGSCGWRSRRGAESDEAAVLVANRRLGVAATSAGARSAAAPSP